MMVLGYTFYSCCRTAALGTGDDEMDGRAENGDGDGDENEKVGCHADGGVVVNVNGAADVGPRGDGTERTSSPADLAVSSA